MITSRRTADGSPVMDIEYTTQVQTPHVPWATPYCKGPIKAFFLPSVKGGRDFVELMQRLEIDAVSVTHDRAWDMDKWGFGDFYDRRVKIWEYETVYGYMVDALTSDQWYDVLVLQSVNGWGLWPKEAREAILQRVKKGAGLVIVRPFEGQMKAPELSELSPLVGGPNDTVDDGGYPVISAKTLKTGAWKAEGSHFITKNIPLDAIAWQDLAYFPYKAKGTVILTAGSGDPLGAVGRYGKGRTVAFGWYNRDLAPQHKDHAKPVGGLSSNSDFWRGGFSSCTWRDMEYVYAMLARAVVWAARKEPETRLSLSASKDGSSLKVKLSGKRRGLAVEAVVNNEWGCEEARITRGPGEISRGDLTIDLPTEALAAGVHVADVMVRQNGKAVEWGAVRFDLPRRARIASIKTDREVYAPGEKVKATVVTAGSGGPVRMEAATFDAFGRVVDRKFSNVEPGASCEFTLSAGAVLTPQMWVRVRLTENGRTLDEKKSARLTAVPDYDRNLHDAELIVAQYDRGHGDYVEAVRDQLLDFGTTNGYYGYSKLLCESGAEGGGIYWYHRAPYTKQKEKYLRTGDKKYLTRVPCLHDPAFQKSIRNKVVATAVKGTKYAPLSYYVQDEGSLTCYRDEVDFCFGEHTLAAMRKWLKGEYGSVKALNAEWGTDFASWDKVVPMTIEEARDHGNFAPWADHRTFMEISFADYFKLVRDSVREVDADARVRMSGCQVSSPHTGMNYWRLHKVVEYFEAYSGGNQFEFHQSFAGPTTILGTWIGYGQKGRTSNHKIWDAFFHQVRLFSIFWEWAVLNPDLTLSGSAEDMAVTWRELYGSGASKMLFSAERDNSRIAVHYSYPSIHAAYALNNTQRFEASRQGWLNVLQDLGYQQSFLSRQQIEAGELTSRKFKVFVMPMSYAVSPQEAEEIKRFVKSGGRLLGDFQTAVMDDHCKRQEKGLLDDVFGIRRYNMRNEPFFINREPVRTKSLPAIDARDVQEANVILEEPGVRAVRGDALFLDDFTGNVPGAVVNRYGKGKAAYLNFGVDVCAGDADSQQAKAVKSALAELLAYFKARPIMEVSTTDGAPLDHVEMFGYRSGGVRYFCLLRENVGTSVQMAYDGIVHGGEEAEAVAEKINVVLPVSGHVYDCLAKKYVGECGAFESTVEGAQAKIFAVYPYKINDLEVTVKPAGNVVRFDARVAVSAGKAKEHTITLSVFDPDGKRHPLYSKNLTAKAGRVRGKVTFSLEGESGIWKLVFTEAASGAAKKVEVMVP